MIFPRADGTWLIQKGFVTPVSHPKTPKDTKHAAPPTTSLAPSIGFPVIICPKPPTECESPLNGAVAILKGPLNIEGIHPNSGKRLSKAASELAVNVLEQQLPATEEFGCPQVTPIILGPLREFAV